MTRRPRHNTLGAPGLSGCTDFRRNGGLRNGGLRTVGHPSDFAPIEFTQAACREGCIPTLARTGGKR